jgi:hypothetical protein
VKRSAKFALALALLSVVLVSAALALRAFARAELAASDAAWASNDAGLAISHARRAASSYVPGSPLVGEARARLAEIARTLERRGDLEGALFAWRAARASAFAVRSWQGPDSAFVQDTEQAIARLVALQRSRVAPSAEGSKAVRRPSGGEPPELASLPRPFASACLLGGALAWLLGAYRLILLWAARSLRQGGPLRWACGLTLFGALGWATGLLLS